MDNSHVGRLQACEYIPEEFGNCVFSLSKVPTKRNICRYARDVAKEETETRFSRNNPIRNKSNQ